MALIERSQNELDFIQTTSQVNPEPTEYAQGDYSALLQTFNSLAASVKRGDYERMEVDTSRYEGVPFSRQELRNQLTAEGVDGKVIDEVMASPVDNWEEATRRVGYLKNLFEMEQQVQENFSTAGMLALGVPAGILDIDAFLINPTLAGVRKVNKALNVSSRLGKVASYSGAGALVGAESMLTYEATTGVYRDDSLIESAIAGSLLMGTLGYLTTKAPKQDLIEAKDATGRVLSKEERLTEQVANAQKEYDQLVEVLDELKGAQKAQTETKEAVGQAEVLDRSKARADNRIVKEQNKEKRDYARNIFETARTARMEAGTALKSVTDNIKSLVKEENKITKATEEYNAQVAQRKEFVKETAPLKGQVTKLKNQLAGLKGKYDKKSTAQRQALNEKLAETEKKFYKSQARITRLEAKIAKYDQKAPERLSIIATEKELAKEAEANKQKDLELVTQRETEANAKFKEAKAAYDNSKIKVDPEEMNYRWETMSLREKLAKYDADLSPEGIRKLLKEKGILEKDLEKLNNDELDVSKLYGIKAEKKNYVEKMRKELDSVGTIKDFREAATFKQLPEWARKLVISPVEKLLNHPDAVVRGFTSLLHSGTVYHGKINNRTAWIVRQMLDDRVNRYNKALIHNYRQAVKEGYTGKMAEFETEVAQNARQVTGKMQRDLNEGIDGAIVGKEREELIKQRAGSVQRVHTNQNAWVQKSTDELLDYFEGIHAYGNKLGMTSFKDTLGKGYVKRVYSARKIESMGREAAIERIIEAQRAFAIATNSKLDAEDMAEFRAKAEAAVDGTLDGSIRRRQLTQDLGLPRQSTTTSLKQRGIDAFDDDLIDLMEDDVIGMTTMYGLNVHGRLALKEKLGVNNDEQIQQMLDQMGVKGDDLDNLRVLIETIKGTREISKDPFNPFTRAIKAASTYSSAMHTMGFAIPTVTEIASIAKEFGWSRTIDTLVGNPKEIYNIYKNGTPSEKNTIELMVSYGDAHFSVKANRYDVESSYDSVGRVQEFMDDVVHKEAVFGGLLPLTDALRMSTVSLAVDFMARLSVAKNISDTDLMRLQDMGFDKADLPRIRKTLKVQPDGRIGNTDRKTWGALDEEITAAVMTTVERTILHPNAATLPKFMTDMNSGQFLPRVMFKFMRFPFESYERLLIRGIQEADAKQMMAVAGNIAMWTMILSAKDALKEEDKQKYNGDDGTTQLMLDSFLYNSFTSLPIAAGDTISGLATGENLTNDYRYRIGGAVQSDYEKLRELNPTISLPMYNMNIGDATANALATLKILEDVNE